MISRRWQILLAFILCGASVPGWASFASKGLVTISAGTTVGGGISTALTITAASLPGQAFFGKNLVIPVQVISSTGSISPQNVQVNIIYQLLDPTGNALTAPAPVPVQFVTVASSTNTLNGVALINRDNLTAIQNGGSIAYVFQAQEGGTATTLGAGGISRAPASSGPPTLNAPFQTSILTSALCKPVGPAGALVSAPDLAFDDGHTSVFVPQNAVTSAGSLCLEEENVNSWPVGPNRSKAAAIYTITLQDTTLSGEAQLVLSYAADVNGKVLDLDVDPESLGIYYLDQSAIPNGNGIWTPLSRADIDTTLHTVTGMTTHFSTFALFSGGAIGAADLRPRERIITPNGDGINDTASFTGLLSGEQVHLFDVRGRRVRTLQGPAPVWDGKDDDGKIVPSGVYIYQYTSGGQRVSGVIGVAR